MTKATDFLSNLITGHILSINTAMPCKVLSYNENDCTAKIQPLFKVKEYGKEPETLQPVEDVPVLCQRYKVRGYSEVYEMVPHLQKDDIVQVVFNQRAIDEAIDGEPVYAGIARTYGLQDAVIVGVFEWTTN